MAPSKRRLLLALTGALCVPVVVACNGIVGISDYTRGECSGGGICTDADVPDGPVIDGGKDADSSVVPEGGVGADPVSWARWRMPNYTMDAALPQPPNAPMLKPVNVGGVDAVEDAITQLVWRATVQNAGAQSTLEGARQSCAELAPTGGWRLPKRIELVTLLDFGRHEPPLIDVRVFAGVTPSRVWSSSEVRPLVGGPDQAYWTVSFETGVVEGKKGSVRSGVALCVRAGK